MAGYFQAVPPQPVESGSFQEIFGAISLGGGIAPDGHTEVAADLPVSERFPNIGSRVDGAGMCVMTSIEMAARWQLLDPLRGLRDWCARQAGGGYPEKVERQLNSFQAERHTSYGFVQWVQPNDVAGLRAILASGRIACVTYAGHDSVHYRQSISHMVCCVAFTDSWVCILDNNYVGERELVWMAPSDFLPRWREGGGGWAFYWTAPPPPPPPFN